MSTLVSLAARNISRNMPRLRPMIGILALTFFLLILGNSLLEYSSNSFEQSFTSTLSGDLSVSAAADQSFTLFGSDALIVGEYHVPPTLAEFDELRQQTENRARVRATAGVVTTVARSELGDIQQNSVLFGVDFTDYTKLFPELELVHGAVPQPGQSGLLMQAEQLPGDNPQDYIGQPVLLTSAHGTTFSIREVPLTGIYRYPVQDEALSRIMLVDADTARGLNGYVYGAAEAYAIPEEQQRLIDTDINDMFGEDTSGGLAGQNDAAEATDAETSDDAFDVNDPFAAFADADDSAEDSVADAAAVSAQDTVSGAWNFLLIGLEKPGASRSVRSYLEGRGYTPENGYLVRSWRATVGGSAQLVWYLQLMLNAGLLFVALGAAIITTNALMLSVMERTKEIGTMRALGARRGRVSIMIICESMLVVSGSAAVGLLLGIAAGAAVNRLGIVIDNQYIRILFGGGAIATRVTAGLLLQHLIAAVLLAGLATAYPLKRALGIDPARAMT